MISQVVRLVAALGIIVTLSPFQGFAQDYRASISDQFPALKDIQQIGKDVFIHANQWQQMTGYKDRLLSLVTRTPPQPVALANMIPHAYPVAAVSGRGEMVVAAYTGPTRRYPHGALGDDVEAKTLSVTVNGRSTGHTLPRHQVFEDIAPRLVDMDGDGTLEIVTIRSETGQGGAVVIYTLADGELQELASSRPIGRGNRWLNVAGIADFDGDGALEIAIVVKPHIEGTLQLLEMTGQVLEPRLSFKGFSNHAYGATELRLSAVVDVDGDGVDDLVLPDFRRQNLVAVSFGADLTELFRIPIGAGVAGPVIGVTTQTGPVVLAKTGAGQLAIIARD